MRGAIVVALILVVLGALIVGLSASAAPLARTCSPALSDQACEGAVDAVLRRGLPGLHPLIVGARVEPGPAPGPQDLGHRATVYFDLLALPSSTSVELHYDQGAHWGGVLDRDQDEIAAWALAPVLLAGLLGVGIVALAWKRRRDRPTG